MKSIGQRFHEFEQSETRAGEHERLHRLAAELAGRYVDSTAR